MPYLRCSRCGAIHFSVGRNVPRAICPRCLEPILLDARRLSVHRRLEPTAEAAAAARQALVEAVSSNLAQGDAPLTDAATVATELVSNAVKHGGRDHQPIEFIAMAGSDAVLIEVTDTGPGFEPAGSAPAPDGESGWGLLVVDRLSTRWGAEQARSFKVWAEVPTGPTR